MSTSQARPTIPPTQKVARTIQRRELPEIPVWNLLIRVIPLMASFILFILAAGANVNKWGPRVVQLMLVLAVLLGIAGIAVFIPKRDQSLR
jgi:hypothetical protein